MKFKQTRRACMDTIIQPLHIPLAMRVLVLLSIITFQSVSADIYSQNTKVSLSMENALLGDVLEHIESIVDYKFIYSHKVIDVSDRVTITAENEPLGQVLGRLFRSEIDVSFENKYILISSKKTPSLPSAPPMVMRTISGTVTDDIGSPLFGASVIVKGTSIGVTTDIEGEYSIEYDFNPEDILVVSYLGYTSEEVVVGGESTINVSLKASSLSLEAVTVVGSRGKPRTDIERPVPVDVLTSVDLQSTGQTDLGQMVQFTSPSFNSAKYGVNGTTNYADPATLRGMSPDQSLVLINGKRRHQFAAINLNVAPGLGTVVTDLNGIPSGAIKRTEVLRDGAAAQYGSDAIAGIINLALNDSNSGGTFQSTGGIHQEGDGITFKNSLNFGFDLGKEKSFVNVTLEHFSFSGTNRSDPYTGKIYPDAPDDYATTGPTEQFPYFTATPRADRGVYPQGETVVGNYGSNENDTYQAFINASYPIGESTNIYTFGGLSRKDITAYGFFRNPARFSRAVLEVFPDGYVPILPGTAIDKSLVVGFDTKLSDWTLDVSYSTGQNGLTLENKNSTNPSLGRATTTEFLVGSFEFNQDIIEAGVSKSFDQVSGIQGMNLAFGGQFRTDNFKLIKGSLESYQVGPLASTLGKDVGSSARPGIAPADENDLTRTNFGVYADVELDITEKFLIATALRYEQYSDFGGNLSGKLALRYKVTDNFSVRGSYNRGFRAPSLAQIGNRQNTSTAQNNEILITKQISSDDSRLQQLGIEEPKAEISDNFNVGITANFLDGALLFTLDAFRIGIDERIVISERVSATDYPAVKALFPDVKEIRFFTNHINTVTQGLDLVINFKKQLNAYSKLNLSIAGTINVTEVTGQKDTPSEILAGAASDKQGLKLLGKTAIELIEVAQPQQKLLVNATYSVHDLTFNARASYFGEVQAFSRGLSAEDSNVTCDDDGRCVQTFGAKTVTDLSVSYKFPSNFMLTVGSNNVFDVYPDKYNNTADGFTGQASSYASGQIPYSRNSNQFGFNGRYYFVTGTLNF